MAKKRSGDWRNPERIRAWAAGIAAALPAARPRPAVEPAARSPWRLLAHGVAGWAACALVMAALLPIAPLGIALMAHAIAAPIIFAAISVRYFGAWGARDPLPTALAFTAIVALLDAVVVAALVQRSFAMFASFAATWLPFALIFAATWITGAVMTMMPGRSGGRGRPKPAPG
jgi:hypothetical protein